MIDRRHFGILSVAIVTAWAISAQLALGGVDTVAQNQTLYKKPLYNSVTASGVSLD
jgi:hypothetical protein